jgi:ketosteroid isomerase-like protein
MNVVRRAFAETFAHELIDAWNAHDLVRVLAHYAEDFEMSSPLIVTIAGERTGTLRGKNAVAAYWTKALSIMPDLRFELRAVLVGIDSVTLHYRGTRGRLSSEVLHFRAGGKVARAFAHYAV